MCGLVGIAGRITPQMRDKIFPNMLDVCQLRGRDSTGVITVLDNLDYDYVKRVGPPTFLTETDSYQKRIGNKLSHALVGHCRHKTSGAVDNASAHPFAHGDIVGVHNGTLRSYFNLPGHSYQRVDSDVLFEAVDTEGPVDTFESITGAWACVWWNNDTETLNFIRNDERPLWFTWSKDMQTMFWASEPWMFGAVERTIDLWEPKDPSHKFYQLETDTLVTYKINPNPKGDDKRFTMHMHKITPKSEVRSYSGNRAGSGQGGSGSRVWSTRESSDGKVTHLRNNTANRGGSVANPFVPTGNQPEQLKLIPPERTTTQDGSGTTPMGDVEFLRNSVNGSGSSMQSTVSQTSKKPTLSLPNTSSGDSQATSKSGLCGGSSMSSERKASNGVGTTRSKRGVSFRNVVGIEYITRNATGREFTLAQFDRETGSTCSFCRTPIGSLHEVADFISDTKFICTTCTTEGEI